MSAADETRLRAFRPWRDLPPFFIAAAILFFIGRGKDWNAVAAALAGVNLPLFLLGGVGYVIVYYFVNAGSYWLVYNYFGARLRLREVMTAFGASLLPQAVFPALGQGLFLLYLVKRQKVPLLQALGNNLFIIYIDMWVMAVVVGAALWLLPRPPAILVWWFVVLAPALLLAGWYARFGGGRRLFPQLYQSSFLNALRSGTAGQYGGFFALRMGWQACQIFFHSLALAAVGIAAPMGMVGVLVVLMALTALLPVAALGFGGPNLVAEYFAPWVAAGHSPAETAFTYGLLFQTCFLLGRLAIGTVLAAPLWRTLWGAEKNRAGE